MNQNYNFEPIFFFLLIVIDPMIKTAIISNRSGDCVVTDLSVEDRDDDPEVMLDEGLEIAVEMLNMAR